MRRVRARTNARATLAATVATGWSGASLGCAPSQLATKGSTIRGNLATVTAMAAVAALVAAAVPVAAADGQPGVTKDVIRVGGVASPVDQPGPHSRQRFATAFDGVAAYFETVNGHGGVFGRTLKVVATIDDRGSVSRNAAANRSLVESKKVFAVIPEASQAFAGATYLAVSGTPTFGWNTDPSWSVGNNLFGESGSYRCVSCPAVGAAFVAKQIGAAKAAVVTSGTRLAVQCGDGLVSGLEKYGIEVGFRVALSPATGTADVVAAAQRAHDDGVQLVATCMVGVDGLARIATALRSAGADGTNVYATEGYGPSLLAALGKRARGVYLALPFAPWEQSPTSQGTRQFLAAMKRRHLVPTEPAQAGWIDGELFVAGIQAAGKRFTQASVVDAINAMTNFDASGMIAGVSWVSGGHAPGRKVCSAFVEARNGRFQPRFGTAGSPFVCFADNPLPGTLPGPGPASGPAGP